jgi:hypothetical protein
MCKLLFLCIKNFQNRLVMGTTENQEKEGDRSMEGLDYELDLESPILFSRINSSNIISDKAKGIFLDFCANYGYDSAWTIKLEQGAKLGEGMDRVPFGILNKTITGIGATRLELETQQRNSIIVVPTKSLAYNKHIWAKNAFGENYSMYIGSPIGSIRETISKPQIKSFLEANTEWKKKFLVVADSLPVVIEAISETGVDVYTNYFLMIDEIDTMQSDSIYRPNLERTIDYYFNFDRKMRCAVSATLNEFTNDELMVESYVTTIWEEAPKREITLIPTNYVDDIGISLILSLLKSSNDKILIAYNSLDGILNIIEQLEEYKDQCGVLCSERSNEKLDEYLSTSDTVIDDQGFLQKRIVFMTCAYFAGIDIMDKCNLISISSFRQPFSYLSINRLTQIAGRCRNGNLSEHIIYDISPNVNESEQHEDFHTFKNKILDKSKSYSTFLNATYKAVQINAELKALASFIESFVDSQAKFIDKNYPARLIRFNDIKKEFVPAYFNIDAVLERWNLKHFLYIERDNLRKELQKNHNIQWEPNYINDESHSSEIIRLIKVRSAERGVEKVEEAEKMLLDWINNGSDIQKLNDLCNYENKKIAEYYKAFRRLYHYIETNRLLQDLKIVYDDGRKRRNYNNAVIFWALDSGHAFRSHVLGKFEFDSISNQCRKKPGISVDKIDKAQKMREVFSAQLMRTDIEDDSLADFFSCFFDTSRSGKNDKIIGLNPKNLPEPLNRIPDGVDLMKLFLFPNEL